MGEAVFKSLIERLEKSTSQKPDSVCRTKIEWSSPDSIDRFFQEVAHVSDAFQRSMRKAARVSCRPPENLTLLADIYMEQGLFCQSEKGRAVVTCVKLCVKNF
jgi:hypothetical protein